MVESKRMFMEAQRALLDVYARPRGQFQTKLINEQIVRSCQSTMAPLQMLSVSKNSE